jgi:hypothetical protein
MLCVERWRIFRIAVVSGRREFPLQSGMSAVWPSNWDSSCSSRSPSRRGCRYRDHATTQATGPASVEGELLMRHHRADRPEQHRGGIGARLRLSPLRPVELAEPSAPASSPALAGTRRRVADSGRWGFPAGGGCVRGST